MNQTLTLNPPFSIRRFLKFNLKVFWLFSFVLITILLILYIIQVNKLTQATYLISRCEKKIDTLTEGNKAQEFNFLQVNSLENLEKLVNDLNYEKVSRIHYIRMLESKVVAK